MTHLPHEMYARNAGIPKHAKLFTKGEYSERFILILEGRALVTIGQDQMTFEAGPWHAFGTEMLERLVDRCEKDKEEPAHSKSSLSVDKVALAFQTLKRRLVVYTAVLFYSRIICIFFVLHSPTP